MNLVVNDLDMPLIIKVASIPKEGYKYTLLIMMNISKHLQMKKVMYPIMMSDAIFFTKELLKLLRN
jgi:hypothetical protein